MSVESMWYLSYRDSGIKPTQNRLSRLPEKAMNSWGIALALDHHRGLAAPHGYVNSHTAEERWLWLTHPKIPLSGTEPSVWWLLPRHVCNAMRRATDYAYDRATQRRRESAGDIGALIEIELRRLAKRARSPKGVTPDGHTDRDLRVPPTRAARDAELTRSWYRNMAPRLEALRHGARVRHAKFGDGVVIYHCGRKLIGESVLVRFDSGEGHRISAYDGADGQPYLLPL